MNSAQDLGGRDGFGPVVQEKNEVPFHEEWERRIFGMFLPSAAAVGYSVDEFRHAVERMDHTHCLATSYYEHWLGAFEAIFHERGIVSKDELVARMNELKEKEAHNA